MSPKASLRFFTLLLLLTPLIAPVTLAESEAAPTQDAGETFRDLGLLISQQLAPLGISDSELDKVIEGIRAGLSGQVDVNPREIMPKVQALAAERAAKAGDAERKASAEFLAKKAAEAKAKGGEVTESGLVYTDLVAGTGASPGPTDRVKVHYHGTLRTGDVFDSSVDRGEPAEFPLNRVISCWTEGVAMMKVGGKSRLLCPASIAYGDQGRPGIPGGAALNFEVELLDIVQ